MRSHSEDSDFAMLNYLRLEGAANISALIAELGVTATAVRQRLQRLMDRGLVERQTARHGRGRPRHVYSLTEKGQRSAGDNFADLAMVLWEELRSLDDSSVRRGLLKRIAQRFVSRYRDDVKGETLRERMGEVARLMGERDIPFDVDDSRDLPVLSVLACPYPELAKADRGICTMEKLMLSEILGEGMRLAECRLDGATCCTFTPSVSSAMIGDSPVENC